MWAKLEERNRVISKARTRDMMADFLTKPGKATERQHANPHCNIGDLLLVQNDQNNDSVKRWR